MTHQEIEDRKKAIMEYYKDRPEIVKVFEEAFDRVSGFVELEGEE